MPIDPLSTGPAARLDATLEPARAPADTVLAPIFGSPWFEANDTLKAVARGDEAFGRGARGPAVRLVQNALKGLGYAVGSADGVFGRGTEREVALFQRSKGIPASGVIDSATIVMLDDALADLRAASDGATNDAPTTDDPVESGTVPITIYGDGSGTADPAPRDEGTSRFDWQPTAPVDSAWGEEAWGDGGDWSSAGSDPAGLPPGVLPRGALRMLDDATGGITGADVDFEALARFTGAADVAVAILDDGVALGHPTLRDNIATNPYEAWNGADDDGNGLTDDVNGFDFMTHEPAGATTPGWHGTGVAGVAAYGTKHVKVLAEAMLTAGDDGGSAPDVGFVIDHAVSSGARLIHMSWTSESPSDAVDLRAAMARHPDVLFVSAAGNEGDDVDSTAVYPAGIRSPNHIVVANVTRSGALFRYEDGGSNYGARSVDLGAVGDDVRTTAAPNDRGAVCGPAAAEVGCFAERSGTSFSAPIVSNVGAKLLSLSPTLTAAEARAIITRTVSPRTSLSGLVRSGGVVDPLAAYRVAAALGRVAQGERLETAVAGLPGGLTPSARESTLRVARELLAER